MSGSVITTTEGRGGGLNARELLDAARSLENEEAARARGLAQQARLLARSLGQQTLEAEALYRLASISYYMGAADEAFSVAVDARDLARSCGAQVVEAWALNLMGVVHLNAGNLSEALSCCLHGLELYRGTDHRVDEGNLLNTIAGIHHELGDTDRAIVTYEAALAANAQLGRPEFDAMTLANMAELRSQRNEHFLAVSLGESALEMAREHAPAYVPQILANLGDAYSSLSDIARSSRCFDEALELLAERAARGAEGNTLSAVNVRLMRGRAALREGRVADAVADLDLALQGATSANARTVALTAHDLLSKAHKTLGNFEQALAHSDARYQLNQELFSTGTDLRIKTLQIAHDTEQARQQAEILRLRTGELEAMVRNRTHQLEQSQLDAFSRLAVLAEFRDTDTGEHTIRVGELAGDIAQAMKVDEEWVSSLRLAARLHDIGKVAVPDAILLKAGPLTEAEFAVMKTHTTVGAQILSGSTSTLIQLAAEVALTHHERWDGRGYPNATAGPSIPLSGRITSVADVYDALTSARPYKEAWSNADAVRYIMGARGTQFQPEVVDAFLDVIVERHPELAPVAYPSAV